jgi:hypothetical protein
MTIWTDFIKQYAKAHQITYGCALSQYKNGLKQAYQKFKRGEDWFIEDDIIVVNETINQKIKKEKESKAHKKKREEAFASLRGIADKAFKLPAPIKAPQNVVNVVDRIEDRIEELGKLGAKKGAVYYSGNSIVGAFSYFAVLKKFKGECIPIFKHSYELHISLKINTTKKYTPIFKEPILLNSFGEALKKCIDRGVSVICIFLNIEFGLSKNGHANMLIYRPFERTVERFEPHGEAFANSRSGDSSINAQLSKLFEEKLHSYTEGEVRFVPPNELCPNKKGFQTLEGQIKKLNIEGGGFCMMWSLFVMEMVLNNPNKSTLQIIEKVMEITKKDPQYLANIIRGYVVGVEKTLDETFKFLKKEGFSYSTISYKNEEDVEDDLTSAFILETIFETEKEQREKKQYKPLPPKKQKEKSLEEELFELLMKKTKPQLLQILASVGLKPRGSPTKE